MSNVIYLDTPNELINKWFWSKTFVGYSIKHKIRLFVWISGSMYKWDKEYFFYWSPNSNKIVRKFLKLITPTLNKIL